VSFTLSVHPMLFLSTSTLFPYTSLFRSLLAQIQGLGVEAVGVFFAGGGAVQFVKEYKSAGIQVPLCGSGFLTEGTLGAQGAAARSEAHTSELQSREILVCRLLLEKNQLY